MTTQHDVCRDMQMNPVGRRRTGFIAFLLAWALGLGVQTPAFAGEVTVTDLAGRTVTVRTPVDRFVLSEGRYIPLLAMLRPEGPIAGLVGMMTPLWWTHPHLEAQLISRHPEARSIPLFGSKNADSVSVEKIIDLAPQVAVFGLSDHGPNAENRELIEQLEAAGTVVLFIDFRASPLTNTLPSIELLGRVFGAEQKARAYVEYYKTRFDLITARTAGASRSPLVFMQVHPGRRECCWGMADGMLGPFIGLLGGRNIADEVAPGPTALHTAEFLLTRDPDVWIGTASGTAEEYRAGKTPVALGPGMDAAAARDSLTRYLSGAEFRALSAVKSGRAHSIWHNFYNSPFNIVAVEAIASWLHPELFTDLDPARTLTEIYDRFLPFRPEGTYFATVSNE